MTQIGSDFLQKTDERGATADLQPLEVIEALHGFGEVDRERQVVANRPR